MKNRTKLPNIYIGVVTAVLYLPIVLVIIYSFNESKISSVWGGFSLKWYETLFRDAAMFEALGNSIVLALCASLGAAVIGTLGAPPWACSSSPTSWAATRWCWWAASFRTSL